MREGDKYYVEGNRGFKSGPTVIKGMAMPNMETRWGESTGDKLAYLHNGKFIVDWIRKGKVHLADADWDYRGQITFHSSKHGHIITVPRLMMAIEQGYVKRFRYRSITGVDMEKLLK